MRLVVRKPDFVLCEKQKRRPACTSVQSDQRFQESQVADVALAELALSLVKTNTTFEGKITYVLGAQKNLLIDTCFFSTHNLCFGLEISFFIRTLN